MEFLTDIGVVTLETAKQLKSNGFDVPTNFYFVDEKSTESDSGKYLLRCGKGRDDHNRRGREFYSAPSSVELEKWKK
jgi:hypothetical protein